MSSIRNITASTAVPDDLAKRLGPSGVNEILLILWQGYHDIIADTNITITENTEEDDITQEWYGKISLRWTAENELELLFQSRLRKRLPESVWQTVQRSLKLLEHEIEDSPYISFYDFIL